MQISMSSPDITQLELDAVFAVLATPHLSLGPRLDEFERRMAEYVGAKHAVAVSSGTAGLHLAIIAAGIEQGDEVITTPFSFVSSANCILYERATPVFVDIDPQTFNIAPELIESAITPRTKAVLPVHAFGQPADIDPILEVAERYGLYVIEDSCEAIGSEYKGRRAGVLGDVGIYAFYPNKQMTTGEGGIILTNRSDWDALFRSLRNQGRDAFNAWLDHSRLGYNYRMDEMSAALGLAQLSRIEELLAKRARVADWYNRCLQGVETVRRPYVSPDTTYMSWFVYVVRLAAQVDRDQVMETLKEQGIPSRPYFSCIHLQPFYSKKYGFKSGDFEITESVAKSVLALPFHANMSETKVEYVCDKLLDAIRRQT